MTDSLLIVGSLPSASVQALRKAGYGLASAHCAGDSWKEIVDGGHACMVAALPLSDRDSISFLERARDLNPKIGIVVVAGNPVEIEDKIEGFGIYSVSPLDVPAPDLVDKVHSACELAAMPEETRLRLENSMDDEVTKMRKMRHAMGCDTKIYSPEELRAMWDSRSRVGHSK